MKRLLSILVLGSVALIACQQTPRATIRALGTLELQFDLASQTVQVQGSGLGTQSVLSSSDLRFTAPTSLIFLTDVTKGVNYISATFQVSNLTSAALNDLTLIAYHKMGNTADTALKSIVDFGGTPLTPAQLQRFARAVQPVNMPSAVSPSFTVNDSMADLQYFKESELSSLESVAVAANELTSGEYLLPYGFIARASNTSRRIGIGSNQGTITVAIKLPNTNEPSSANARRFTMTFVAVDEPLGAGVQRLTESYEEYRAFSSAETRAADFAVTNPIALNSAVNASNRTMINGVRTAGSQTSVQRILGERAWQMDSGGDEHAKRVVIGPSGVYVTGWTTASLDGNPSAGGRDGFLVKYDFNGQKLWSRQFGSSLDDLANDVAVDVYGANVLVVGTTSGNMDGNTNAGGFDIFLMSFSSSGVKQWTRQLGTPGNDFGYAVAAGPDQISNDVYVAAAVSGSLDGNPYAGSRDVALIKFNQSGIQQWSRVTGTPLDDDPAGIAVRVIPFGNVVVAGTTFGNLDGNTNAGQGDAFLMQYSLSGSKQWTRQLGTNQDDRAYGLAVDSFGKAYVAGDTRGGLGNTNAGQSDAFLAKYASTGLEWVRQLGTTAFDTAFSIAVDSSENPYITGYTTGHLEGIRFDGRSDLFLSKYDPDGTQKWIRQLGDIGTDVAFDVDIDTEDNAYVAGYTDNGWGDFPAVIDGRVDSLLVRFDALNNLYR